MIAGSLFSGVGGLDLALEHFGYEVAWQSEIDPHCSSVLARHWPDTPNLGDVTTIDWNEIPDVDLIAGGFPCQDLSYAGRGAGLTGERSGLYWHIWHAARVLRPRHVILENVSALLVRGGPTVVASLTALGYDVRWGVVRLPDAGAPHQRRRVFIVADAYDQGSQGWYVGRDGTGQRAARSAGVGVVADATGERHERSGTTRRRGARPADSGTAATDASGGQLARVGATRDGLPVTTERSPGPAADTERLGDVRRHGTRRLPSPQGEVEGDTQQRERARHTTRDSRQTATDPDDDGSQGERWQPAHDRDTRHAPDRRSSCNWGRYTAAIQRWEQITGEPAPQPLDGRRLNPELPRWMMGLPAGWLNGMTRTQALKAAGNAVCWQQAVLALTLLQLPHIDQKVAA